MHIAIHANGNWIDAEITPTLLQSMLMAGSIRFSGAHTDVVDGQATPIYNADELPSEADGLTFLPEQRLYYVQDTRSYTGNSVMWWCPNGNGYTSDLDQAWKVIGEVADKMHRSRNTDVAWPCDEIDKYAQRHFDMQKLRMILP